MGNSQLKITTTVLGTIGIFIGGLSLYLSHIYQYGFLSDLEKSLYHFLSLGERSDIFRPSKIIDQVGYVTLLVGIVFWVTYLSVLKTWRAVV
jgi:hypothetical protein